MKSVIMELTHPPFGRENTYAALFIGSASVSLGVEVTVVLTGEGVYVGLKGQVDPQGNIDLPSTEQQVWDFMELGGRMVVEEQSLSARGIFSAELIEGLEVLDSKNVADLMLDKGDQIMVF
jgi:predicted peroxiredoxin